MAHASDQLGPAGRPVNGFFVLQIALGYEWLLSGLSKVATGDFPSKLGPTLRGMAQNQTGPFKSFLDSAVIPNASLVGWLTMLGELAVGVGLIVLPIVAIASWARLSFRTRAVLLALIGLAGLGAALMSVNYHMLTGAAAPWTISSDPFAPGVDVDSILAILELASAAVCAWYLARLVRAPAAARG